MTSVLTHTEMHSDHRQWSSEELLWDDDVHIWEGELDSALAEMKKLASVFAEHRQGLEAHAEAVRAAHAKRAKHEHALAEYEQGGSGEDLIALARKHEEESEKHVQQRKAHERIKCHHHTVMAHWRLLFKALSKEM